MFQDIDIDPQMDTDKYVKKLQNFIESPLNICQLGSSHFYLTAILPLYT